MQLKIEIVNKTVVVSLGDMRLLTLKNISEVNVKQFEKLQGDTIYKWADNMTYGLSSGFRAGSGGICEQPYGYIEKDGEVIKVAGGGDGSANGLGETDRAKGHSENWRAKGGK